MYVCCGHISSFQGEPSFHYLHAYLAPLCDLNEDLNNVEVVGEMSHMPTARKFIGLKNAASGGQLIAVCYHHNYLEPISTVVTPVTTYQLKKQPSYKKMVWPQCKIDGVKKVVKSKLTAKKWLW